MSPSPVRRMLRASVALALVATFLAPLALGALSGSGNVTDIVQLSTTTSTLGALTSTASGGSASAAPATSGASAFTMTNAGSNVDTFLRYGWGTTPYYGTNSAQTSITIRGTTHPISDLLWFRQEIVSAAPATTTSEYFSPLLVKSSATVTAATFTAAGNACTAWTGTAGAGFSAAAAGTFTFKYHLATNPVNDAPVTSDTFHYCLDTTNAQVYLGKTADFASASRIYSYTSDSANAVLKTYQYHALSGAQTQGNRYCLVAIAGSGTSATPDLAHCQMLAYDVAGSSTAKVYALFDPPAYFPAANQNGALTYGVSGTQWNPYASATTNSA